MIINKEELMVHTGSVKASMIACVGASVLGKLLNILKNGISITS